jgi:predicted membrane protein
LNGDIVVLGVDGLWEAAVEGVKEVGRHFLMFEIWEVGTILIGCVQTTQLVVPLISHPSAFLSFLAVIIMVIFPCFF